MVLRSSRVVAAAIASWVVLLAQAETPWAIAPALDPAKTHAVIVGVLHWQEKSLTTYSPDHRKDRELYEALNRLGVPKENMALLLDEAATLQRIRSELRRIAGRCRKGDAIIFYYAGHGFPTGRGICMANYDCKSGDAESAFAVMEVAEILEPIFKGERVLLFGDCCFSGGLARAAERLSQRGFKAASLTSAAATNTSTNNWTFTHVLVDIFAGSPAADINGDRAITLAEATTEVAKAMKFRENQQHGQSRFGVSSDFRLVSAKGSGDSAAIPKPYQRYEYVQISA